jgi:choline dehydrogenase-like flavoprotein
MRRDLDDIASPESFASELCIIGGGIAGLVLARKMAGFGFDVHLLEAGGPTLEDRSQALYEGWMGGYLHRGTMEGRFRTFGGSSTRWAGQLLPYPDETFAPRPVVHDLSWPVTPAELSPYYPEIHRIMGVDDFSFDENFLREIAAPSLPHEEDVRLRFSKWSPVSRRNLSWTAGRECLASDRVTVFFHANALGLEFSPGGDVAGVTVKNYRGVPFRFTAKRYVIAAGAIETSRLLLNSKGGNPHDQVGRYFFDHVICGPALIAPASYGLFKKHLAAYYRRKTLHTVRLETSARFQEKHRALPVMAHFEFEEPEGSGLALARRFLHNILHGKLGAADGQKWRDLPKALAGGLRAAFDLKVRGRRFPTPDARLMLRFDCEQIPDAESRVRLLDEPDALGVPKLLLDWKRSREEARSLFLFAAPVDAFCRSLGVELKWRPGLLEGDLEAWMERGHDNYHPMGGARMGRSRAESVVDASLRLHGTTNGYVASCAVYPTGGSSNPTFTLMALTLRLADHLKAEAPGW